MMSMLLLVTLWNADSLALRRRHPDQVGMSPERLAAIDRVVERGLAASGFPGASVVVGRRSALVWEKGYGFLDWTRSSAVSPRTSLYDVASLTKVVATTTAIMLLHDRGRIRLEDPVGRYLPAFARGDKARVTIRDLLTHRSGLPAGVDLVRSARTPKAARRLVLGTALGAPPGSRHEYSDLGPDVLGFLVEAVAKQPLDRFLARTVYGPLGMRSTMFRPPRVLRQTTAPTETFPPRGYPVRGEVHDENAYRLGGVAGHAGLFSTARDLAVFAQLLLNGGTYGGRRIISDSTVRLFTRRTAGTRALGWDTCAGGASCGQYMGTTAFGHTGYTGTSLWIDPEREMFVIVLTNWVHSAAGRSTPPLAILHDVRSDIADISVLSVLDCADGIREMPAQLRADRAIGWWR